MRPPELSPLFSSVEALTGVGPRVKTQLAKALALPPGISEPRVIDLIWHTPTGLIDRRAEPTLRDAVPATIATFAVRVLAHKPPPRGNRKVPYRVTCEDETAEIDLVFFHAERAFIERQLPIGEARYVSGRIDRYGDRLQMTHPDYIVPPDRRSDLPMLEPIYGLTSGLSGKVLLRLVRQAVSRVPDLPEWQRQDWLSERGWPSFRDAVEQIHIPRDHDQVSPAAPAWQRLAYDELFAGQIALALVRQSNRRQRGRTITGDGAVRARIQRALPFALTGAQNRALRDIEADMASESRMLRLLQGDVGSGKTVVALMAMAMAVEAGAQAALMAPTEILARQHAEGMAPLAEAAGLRLALLTGREKGKPRREVLARLATGEIDILIGTHAVFQPEVDFADLALAVIDEQHRFGVHQRLALQAKGRDGGANVLAMTATPIPRTLLMTHYGDLDVSRLDEKPPGRKPIVTKAVPIDSLEKLLARTRAQVAEGAQVYWVCPLIENTGASDLAAAEERAAHLGQLLPGQAGLIHGAMSGTDRDAVMSAFADGRLKVLVATTVIEVGVNVPNATIMVIEHAERFGLAQLHQLRGRVGRGSRQSYCILLHALNPGEIASQRIRTLEESEDGFKIAEMDLKLRGGGEVLGARQSGAPAYRIAEVPGADALLDAARDDARLLLDADPGLTSERGQAIRRLLYLFERDEAVRLFRAA
ncbi:MAG: ATP-dependent DNA helicase RecG [Hyphomicrobiaceae bacterium]